MNIKDFLSKYRNSESLPEAIAILYDVLRKNAKVQHAEVCIEELKDILDYGDAIHADQNIFNDESERILEFIKIYNAFLKKDERYVLKSDDEKLKESKNEGIKELKDKDWNDNYILSEERREETLIEARRALMIDGVYAPNEQLTDLNGFEAFAKKQLNSENITPLYSYNQYLHQYLKTVVIDSYAGLISDEDENTYFITHLDDVANIYKEADRVKLEIRSCGLEIGLPFQGGFERPIKVPGTIFASFSHVFDGFKLDYFATSNSVLHKLLYHHKDIPLDDLKINEAIKGESLITAHDILCRIKRNDLTTVDEELSLMRKVVLKELNRELAEMGRHKDDNIDSINMNGVDKFVLETSFAHYSDTLTLDSNISGHHLRKHVIPKLVLEIKLQNSLQKSRRGNAEELAASIISTIEPYELIKFAAYCDDLVKDIIQATKKRSFSLEGMKQIVIKGLIGLMLDKESNKQESFLRAVYFSIGKKAIRGVAKKHIEFHCDKISVTQLQDQVVPMLVLETAIQKNIPIMAHGAIEYLFERPPIMDVLSMFAKSTFKGASKSDTHIVVYLSSNAAARKKLREALVTPFPEKCAGLTSKLPSTLGVIRKDEADEIVDKPRFRN